MGWDTHTQLTSIEEVKQYLQTGRYTWKCLAQETLGDANQYRIWSVYQAPNGERWIHLDLVEPAEIGMSTKDIVESQFPFYFDVPLKFLELAGPTDRAASMEWREHVIDQARV